MASRLTNAPKPRLFPSLQVSTSLSWIKLLPARGTGSIKLSRVPTQIEVWPFEDGFNRVTVDFVNSEMEFIDLRICC